jgi:LPS sulfotransferase NodH
VSSRWHEKQFGQEGTVQPQCSYLICATPRSGSTLLCEALTNTGLAGKPKEYFEALKESGLPRRPAEYFTGIDNAEISQLLGEHGQFDGEPLARVDYGEYARYLEQVIEEGTTPNGVFGAKVMWGYLDDFVWHLHTIPQYRGLETPELLATIFPNLHYIVMLRRDKVRQAVSLWKAIQTQAWKEEDESLPKDKHPSWKLMFHFDAIEHLKQQLEGHEAQWQRYFVEIGVQPFTVVYEDLVNAYEQTAIDILHYLKVPLLEHPVFGERRMKQQADALSEQWVQQYYQVREGREPL